MRTMERFLAFIICCCIVVALVGCGSESNASGNGSPTQAPQSSKPETSSAEETPAPTPTPLPEKKVGYQEDGGPVFIRNTALTDTASTGNAHISGTNYIDAFSLYQLDLETLELVEIFRCSGYNGTPKGYWTSISLNAVSKDDRFRNTWMQAQVFSPDFTKMALNWYDYDKNSSRVGWVDNKGVITDVTGILCEESSDFTAKTPDHQGARFSPNGYFIYNDKNSHTVDVVDIETMTIISSTECKNHLFAVDTSNVEVQSLVERKKANEPVFVCEGTAAGTLASLSFDTYAGDNAVLMYSASGIRKLSYGENNAYPITPETDYKIMNVVYKNGKVLFTATKGTNYVLFEMEDVDGIGSPEKLMDMPSETYTKQGAVGGPFFAYRLMFW